MGRKVWVLWDLRTGFQSRLPGRAEKFDVAREGIFFIRSLKNFIDLILHSQYVLRTLPIFRC
jgi:hypothetical protein